MDYSLIIKKPLIIFFVFVISISTISLFQTNIGILAQEPTPENNGTTQPGDQGSTMPENNGTTQPGDQGSTMPENNGTTQPGDQGSTIVGNVTGFLTPIVSPSENGVKDIFGDRGGGVLVPIIVAVIAIPVIAVAVSKSRGRHHAIESPIVVSDHKETQNTSEHSVEIKTEGGLE